jgi:hypothetical protein
LAASVQSEPYNLFVVIFVVKVNALIVEHRLRFLLPCCVDAEGYQLMTFCVSRFMATLRATIDWLRRLYR